MSKLSELGDTLRQSALDLWIFLLGAAGLVAFGLVIDHLPLNQQVREFLEDLHFRGNYGLLIVFLSTIILRSAEFVFRGLR